MPAVLELCLHLGVSLELSREKLLRLSAIYLFSAVPFFITGIEFSILFARESEHIPQLYGADLAGGALACLLVVPLLNWLGGPNTVLFAACFGGRCGRGLGSQAGGKKNSPAHSPRHCCF